MIEERLQTIIGPDRISTAPASLDGFSRDMSFVDPVRPSCVVHVNSLEEVQKLVKLANELEVSLVPVSSGTPHFRGDTVPSAGGAIIVDLSNMKKIVHISRKFRMVMFEPGVTFDELMAAVDKEGLRLNIPLVPRRTKSVLGSLLEREPVVMPVYHWDIGDPTGCFEVVFGNGELFRTGAAAGSGTIEEQWAAGGSQKEAAGPSSSSWYRVIQGSQGTMGIVTWGTARCEIKPKLEEPFLIGSADLQQVTETLHWLIRLRLANECLVLNNVNVAALFAQNVEEFQAIKNTLPPWVIFFNVASYNYFPEERIHGQLSDLSILTERLGVKPVKTLGGVSALEMLSIVQHTSTDPYWKLRNKGNCQDVFFISVYENLQRQIDLMRKTADSHGVASTDIGIYIQPIVQGVNCHCEFNIFYDTQNPRESTAVKNLTTAATRILMDNEAFFSRPYGETADAILNRDAATVAALRKIKHITDPGNIMNPGKLCF
ncbi:MAG: FAD-binding oxidoreductase [Actinobacteria bacterium]|nr:FAD-binding oxidoreductase [Actinomycetota bacterium]